MYRIQSITLALTVVAITVAGCGKSSEIRSGPTEEESDTTTSETSSAASGAQADNAAKEVSGSQTLLIRPGDSLRIVAVTPSGSRETAAAPPISTPPHPAAEPAGAAAGDVASSNSASTQDAAPDTSGSSGAGPAQADPDTSQNASSAAQALAPAAEESNQKP